MTVCARQRFRSARYGRVMPSKIECPECDREFRTLGGLRFHTERAHPNRARAESSEARVPSPHQKANDTPKGPKGTLELSGPPLSGPSAKVDLHAHDHRNRSYTHSHQDGELPHDHDADGQPRFEAQSEQAHEPLICGATIKIPWDDGRTATAVCGSPEGHDGRHIALAEGDPSAVTWADGDAPLWLVPLEPRSEEPVADVFEPVADDRAGKDELADGDKGLLPPKEGEESSRPPFRLKLLPIFRFGKRRTDS